MEVVVLIGRILFAILFVGSGVNHLMQVNGMTGYAQSRGVPLPKVAVVVSGIVIIIGGLSVLLGIWADLGALLLLIHVVLSAALMHTFWTETDEQARQGEMTHFMKNVGLAGAALMLFAFFAYVDDLGLTITGPLFSLS
ncbi:DoxX family protein [Haloechinothrix sp. YIM 98757]|uniref:DoxX family protein n=2 Tax=Haloechinothrix aidingensis TaxID=2752311 RepID=A0A838A046_9PSEU|nr:DoxX family protein [Haloechinothrix aidingensis]MBA0124433.1 DoxX family protein [Haloechinothrix aidingensis]